MQDNTLWLSYEPDYQLNENADVWMVKISDYFDKVNYFYNILSNDEKERANKFYFEKDKNSFSITRGILRIILGKYLRQTPENISFFYTKYGKPYILSNTKFDFNISHSGEIALYAFSGSGKVGIDVEFMRDKISYLEISKRFFSEYERECLAKISKELQREAFFNGWTRKEAYIKLKGKGLSIPLNSFDISIDPDKPAKIINSRDDNIHFSNWKIFDIVTEKNYKAAIIVEKSILYINYYRYN